MFLSTAVLTVLLVAPYSSLELSGAQWNSSKLSPGIIKNTPPVNLGPSPTHLSNYCWLQQVLQNLKPDSRQVPGFK